MIFSLVNYEYSAFLCLDCGFHVLKCTVHINCSFYLNYYILEMKGYGGIYY